MENSPSTPVKKKLRMSDQRDVEKKSKCFFCEKYVDLHIDHQASTFSFDVNVREMANALQDSELIGKL